jgi:hypothetical protein
LTISSRPPSCKDSDGAQLLWIGQRHDHYPPLLRRPLLRAAVISEAVIVHHRSARVALLLNAGGSVLLLLARLQVLLAGLVVLADSGWGSVGLRPPALLAGGQSSASSYRQ